MVDCKNQKGAITIIVLVTVLFLLAFLMSSYMIVSNRAQKQKEMSKEIQQMYEQHDNLIDIYNSYFNDEIIPIYTAEQLLKIGSNEHLIINNKYCKMEYTATYALMRDVEIDMLSDEVSEILGGGEWIPIHKNTDLKGAFEWNGHTIKVVDKTGKVTTYFSESV